MKNESLSTNFFLLSLTTSTFLTVLGILLFILQFTAVMTLFAIVIFIVGIVQVIVDVGWVSMIKINRDIPTWKEAYVWVARKRNMKLFLVPFLFDLSFLAICLVFFATYGLNL